jgi:hypothetical protein
MADISITAASVAASNQATIRREYPFGATVTAGQLVYLDSNNRWQLMDSNAASTGNGVTDTRGIALHGGANTQPAAVVTADPDFTPGGTLTNAAAYYASPNAGALAPAADITTGNYAVFMGVAKSTTKLNLNPTAAGIAV